MLVTPALIVLINIILSKKIIIRYKKISPFGECGFDSLSFNCLPFSIQFFLIRIIFLIFDTEIILLILLIILTSASTILILISTILFIFILIIGLYLEYLENSIE